jgi:hypothetical protein
MAGSSFVPLKSQVVIMGSGNFKVAGLEQQSSFWHHICSAKVCSSPLHSSFRTSIHGLHTSHGPLRSGIRSNLNPRSPLAFRICITFSRNAMIVWQYYIVKRPKTFIAGMAGGAGPVLFICMTNPPTMHNTRIDIGILKGPSVSESGDCLISLLWNYCCRTRIYLFCRRDCLILGTPFNRHGF